MSKFFYYLYLDEDEKQYLKEKFPELMAKNKEELTDEEKEDLEETITKRRSDKSFKMLRLSNLCHAYNKLVEEKIRENENKGIILEDNKISLNEVHR